MAGGHPTEIYVNGGRHPRGGRGVRRKELPKAKLGLAKWTVGGVAEVAWAMAANHAGGYAYRLCRADGEATRSASARGNSSLRRRLSILYPNGTRVSIPRRRSRPGPPPPGHSGRGTAYPPAARAASLRHVRRALAPVAGLDYGSSWNKQVNCFIDSGATSSKAGARAWGAPRSPVRPGFRGRNATTRTPGSGRACGVVGPRRGESSSVWRRSVPVVALGLRGEHAGLAKLRRRRVGGDGRGLSGTWRRRRRWRNAKAGKDGGGEVRSATGLHGG